MSATETPLSKEQAKRYLLGDLPEHEQVALEDRAFGDKEYSNDLVAMEDDLIDAYVHDELSAADREKFEKRFFTSEQRRSRVEFARALATVTTEEAARKSHTIGSENVFVKFLRSLSPAPAFGLAAATLLLVIGGAWLITDAIRTRSELSRLRAAQQASEAEEKRLAGQLQKELERSQQLEGDLQQERSRAQTPPTDEQKSPSSSQSIIALMLGPTVSRGNAKPATLLLKPDVRTVNLQVGIDPQDSYSSFKAELRSPGGQIAWSRTGLRGRPGRILTLSVPASVFRTGRYELALSGVTDEGRSEDIGFNYFDVEKK